MIIRYKKPTSNSWGTTPDFDPAGKALNSYRLGILRDGKVLTGNALMTELQKPLYPNVPFTANLVRVQFPKSHYGIVENVPHETPEGFIIYSDDYTLIWDVTEEEYLAALASFTNHLKTYLVVVREYYLPNIPNEPGTIWQNVDMSKPYRYRYTPYEGDQNLYKGNFYLPVENMDFVFDVFAKSIGTSSNPLMGITKKTV